MKNKIYQSVKTKSHALFGKTRNLLRKIITISAVFFKNLFKNITEESESKAPDEDITYKEQWKTKVLEDFKLWLSEIESDEPPDLSLTPDTCDLYTLLSEFMALKQEIKMQNREQHRTLKSLTDIQSATDSYKETMALFNEKTRQIDTLEQNIRQDCEKRTSGYFFDIRDALLRGKKACLEVMAKKSFFRPLPKNIGSITEGYDMAIRKFDNSLAMLDIYPVETTGMVFDPMTMNAIETKTVTNLEKGIVIEEVSGGFKRGNEVLRYAQVIVAG